MTADFKTDERVQRFWSAYVSATSLDHCHFTIMQFGDSDELANNLVDLVVAGPKRATTSLHRDYNEPGEELPRAGDLAIVIDSSGSPHCLVQVTQVDIKPIRDVDERFAWDEGEGDRILAYWMSAHMRYFARDAARRGFAMHDAVDVVLERFKIVWPPEIDPQTS